LLTSGLEATAEVALQRGGTEVTGRASAGASRAGVHRAVAAATLRAVEQLVGETVRFELDHLELTTAGAQRTVVVSVTLLAAGRAERLTGAAHVREDVRQAVVRASLDAVNRRMDRLLTQERGA